MRAAQWAGELERWLAPFVEGVGRKDRRRWAPVYVRGLLAPGERKSIEPLAEAAAPGEPGAAQALHHFLTTAPWDAAPVEAALAREAQRLVGGPDAVLIVDDTALLKKGEHSVGVGRQYAGVVGKLTNCQALVSLTLARREVPVPVALRLFLPEEWTRDPARCRAAGVPDQRLAPRSKGQLALDEIDRVMAAGVRFGVVLADAGYGAHAGGVADAFRRGLSARGLTWAVGALRSQLVYPAEVAVHEAPRPARGRPPTRRAVSVASEPAEAVLARARWRRVAWRTGTKGPLAARFAAVRVRLADGVLGARMRRLPGEEVWLVGEQRTSGARKYYLSDVPPNATLRRLAATIKARWSCEQAHQQLKEELGLDHFEGRSWAGLHRHALLAMLAFAFLQRWRFGHLRLRAARAPRGRGENPPDPPHRPACGDRSPRRRVTRPVSELRRAMPSPRRTPPVPMTSAPAAW